MLARDVMSCFLLFPAVPDSERDTIYGFIRVHSGVLRGRWASRLESDWRCGV